MLKAKKINEKSQELKTIKELYREAFPRAERVPMKYLLEEDNQSELSACFDSDVFCGFYATLTVGDITHILFLAVEPALRDRGYGSRILALISDRYAQNRIILDIEAVEPDAPNAAQRIRRKQFYEKNGYRESGIRYVWRGVPYEILVKNGSITKAEFDAFWDSLDGKRRDEL